METENTPGPSEESLELVAASGGVANQVMAEICQRVLDGFGMPAEWALSIVVPIFMWKGDIRNCSYNRAVKLDEHGMRVMERVLEKRLGNIVSVVEMQFVFIPVKGTTDVFIL